MTIKVSTGLRNYMLSTGSLKTALADGFIHIYDDTVPAPSSADDSIGAAVPLVTISLDGGVNGIEFAIAGAANGTLEKESTETWKGTIDFSGTATWYRHVGASDSGGLSITDPRIQGTVGTAAADLNLSDTTLTATAEQLINYYSVTLPTV